MHLLYFGVSLVLGVGEFILPKELCGYLRICPGSRGPGHLVGPRSILLRSFSQVNRFFDLPGGKSSGSKSFGNFQNPSQNFGHLCSYLYLLLLFVSFAETYALICISVSNSVQAVSSGPALSESGLL